MRSTRFPDLPPLASLLVFESAAFHNSFSLAGDELSVSASAVAHQVKKLEAALGKSLFVRHARGVELNSQGREYFGQISNQLQALQQISERLQDFSKRPLRINTQHAIAQLWLQPRLNQYLNDYDDHELEITATSIIDSPPADADVSISFFARPPRDPNWQMLWVEEIMPVHNPALRQDKPVLYQDVHWQDDWTYWQMHSGVKAPIILNRVRRASLYTLILQSVLDGQGVMVARKSLVNIYLSDGSLMPWISNAKSVEYGAYYLYQSQTSWQNPYANQFCAWVRDQV